MDKIKNYGRRTFASLKIRNYRLYFIGQAISLCGTWMQSISQDWLVLKLTGSGTQLGLVSAAQFLPILLFGPLGGVLADRFDKRKILYCTQTMMGIFALILGTLVLTGTVQLWMVYVLATCLGFCNMFDNPARQAFVSEMVGKESLLNAVTLNSTEINLARVLGPTLAGAVIATAGLGLCFIANGVSYIAVLIMLYVMDQDALMPSPRHMTMKGKLREGWEYLKASPILFNTFLMCAIIGTLTYEFSTSLPLLAQFVFHGDAGTYAALIASMGGGSVVGGLFIASRKRANMRILVVSAFLFGLSFLIVGLMPTLLLACLLLFFVGFFSINFTSITNTTLQLESAPEMRGRVISIGWAMAFLGSTVIGAPIVGWVGQHFGAREAIVLGGIAAMVAAGIGYFRVPMGKGAEQK